MFISIIGDYDGIDTDNNLVFCTYTMLSELMHDKLIKIFTLKYDDLGKLIITNFKYDNLILKKKLLKIIDIEWKNIEYQLPSPDELFWITSDLSENINFT